MLGSALAHIITLKSLENNTNIKQLCLVDNDVIGYENLPYLNSRKCEYVHKPKVIVLRDILLNISTTMNITPFYTKYPDLYKYTKIEKNKIGNSYVIDCRDTSSEYSSCSLKLNLDGGFGVINLKPADKEGVSNSRYTIGNSRYFATLFAGLCCQLIFDNLSIENEKTVVDLRKGEFYNVMPNK